MKSWIAVTMLAVLFVMQTAKGGDVLKIGSKAPDFALKDAKGNVHHLSDYQGKMVVLYFYPKDFTPGCTAEACNLRDNYQALLNKGLVVLGVSYDNPEKHKKFSEKYRLPFPVLSDTSKTVAKSYGVSGGFFGFIGPKRTTFLIDRQGYVLHVFKKVKTDHHAQQILDFLNGLKKQK